MKAPRTHPLSSTFRVPYHPDVTEEQVRRAAEIWADLENAERLRDEKRANELAAALRRRDEELRCAIGAEHSFALQQFKRGLQLEAARKRSPVRVTADFRAQEIRRQKRRVRRFLTDRGLSAGEVSAAVSEAFEGISSPFDTDIVGEISDVLEEPPVRGPHAFQTFTPPFTGHSTGYVEVAVGFRVEHDNFIDPEVGQVGLAIRLDDRDEYDEFASGYSRRSSMVAFWFTAPSTGIVEVFTDYQCIQARHKLTVEDQFGFSHAKVTQQHLLSMQVVHPNVSGPTFALAGQLTYDGDDDVFVDHRHLPGGHKIQARTTSNGVVPAGERVVVAVGCRTEDDARSNDMEVHSESIYGWFIPRVHVRILA